MKNSVWQTLAIVFIILFVIVTIFVIIAWNWGNKISELEDDCIEECSDVPEVVSFYFDNIEMICYCLDEEGNIVN